MNTYFNNTYFIKISFVSIFREVFCCENLLNCDEKIDGKECTLSKYEEITIVQKIRGLYKPFDFTLE